MFLVSKIAWLLLTPSSLIFCVILLGAALKVSVGWNPLTRFEAWGRRTSLAGALCLAIATLTPLGPSLVRGLETAYAPLDGAASDPRQSDIAGIILLGGAVESTTVQDRVLETMNDSIERVRYAAELARRFPQTPVYVAGGQVFAREGARSEAAMTQDLLTELGLAPNRVRLEAASRNTAENARLLAAILAAESGSPPQRDEQGDPASEAVPEPGTVDARAPTACFLLVTSAFHMKRAMAAFDSVGVPVRAAPTDWRSDDAAPFLTSSLIGNLGALDLAAREYWGIAALWATTPRSREHLFSHRSSCA